LAKISRIPAAPQDDPKQALVQLLSENLTQQLQAHQQAVYGALSSIQPLAAA
jgi:phenylpyruvate tautomerase PptA (4-oxalocrotonate tautomerase family)